MVYEETDDLSTRQVSAGSTRAINQYVYSGLWAVGIERMSRETSDFEHPDE